MTAEESITITTRKSLYENIKILRQKNGWSQKDLADRLGISIPALSKIETGFTDISLSRLEQISCVYKITAAELLDAKNGKTDSAPNLHLSILKKKLAHREREIINLRKKIIELYEQIQDKGK
ncbi:helix-turn-helix domain-containing protein [Mucilaginibacter sp. OK098]|uniref:helix-turn-helix domain-containing protein n=1 Tax=Mucilaginibacter sp. OK098 TaxID=1855297 RepID=UPI00091BA020|nr:helix-turn-helix transcriptional regulator [Mucilaginibacter sp. OK098]SHN14204.1 Helix-turn-helix [Mucilaginibacter sp. OK098]